MYSAILIAKWFLLYNNAEMRLKEIEEEAYEGISSLKLQKLLYYAQGIAVALTDSPLFDEPIYAWKHGPVVESVHQEYKQFGKENIEVELTQQDEAEINQMDNLTNEILHLTYDNFAIYTVWQLRNMTHEKGSPWYNTVRNSGLNSEIPLDSIKEYFLRNVVDND